MRSRGKGECPSRVQVAGPQDEGACRMEGPQDGGACRIGEPPGWGSPQDGGDCREVAPGSRAPRSPSPAQHTEVLGFKEGATWSLSLREAFGQRSG